MLLSHGAAFLCGLFEDAACNLEGGIDSHPREGGVLVLRDRSVFLPDSRDASSNNFCEEFKDALRECDGSGFEDVCGCIGFWDGEDQGIEAVLRDNSCLQDSGHEVGKGDDGVITGIEEDIVGEAGEAWGFTFAGDAKCPSYIFDCDGGIGT